MICSTLSLGQSEGQRTEVDLKELVQDTLSDFQSETKGRVIRWTVQPLPSVQADRALLRLVLVNLISNALKFTGARAEAEIEIGCAGDSNGEIVIFIRDNGAGFDPNTFINCSASSSDCIKRVSSKALALAWRMSNASSPSTAAEHGRKVF